MNAPPFGIVLLPPAPNTYGYRLHMAVDTSTDLPLAWRVQSANAHASTMVAPLLGKLHALGIHAETCAMDKGYDIERVYGECAERHVVPIIRLRQTPRRATRRAQAADLRARAVPLAA